MSQVAPNIIAAHELEYKKFKYSHPTYRHKRVVPLNGSDVIVPIASTVEALIELPAPLCANFAESYLTFKYRLTASVAKNKRKEKK